MHKKSSPVSSRNIKRNYKLAGSLKPVQGIIESYTIVRSPPEGFEKFIPYILALIKLDDGKKVTSQVVDCDNVKIGMKVEACLRKVYEDGPFGLIHYGTKFRVVS